MNVYEERNIMEKNVCINIKSVQNSDEGEDVTELFTYGKMKKINSDNYCVSYEETDAMGFEGCRVTLYISRNEVRLLRSGNASADLVIERGKKHHCHYGTPYGDFMVGINTDALKNEVGERGGDLYLKYTVDVNSGFLSENEMFINIKECSRENKGE